MKKTLFLVTTHGLCIWAETVLWQKPFNMPVPVLMFAIGLVWAIVIILSIYHAFEIYSWWNAPSPDFHEIIRQDELRRQLEQERLYANQWVDP